MDAKDMQRGFNSGYYLRSNAPEIANRFAVALKDRTDAYAVGFLAGIKEKDKERYIGRGRNIDKSNIKTSHSQRTKSKDKDIGDKDR